MRYYRVTIDLKAADTHDRTTVEVAVQQAVGYRNVGLIPLKVQAELITPSQAGEKP